MDFYRIIVLVIEVPVILEKSHLHLLINCYKVHEKNIVHNQCSVSFSVVSFEARCWTKSWLLCTISTLVLAFFSFLLLVHTTHLFCGFCLLCVGGMSSGKWRPEKRSEAVGAEGSVADAASKTLMHSSLNLNSGFLPPSFAYRM